MRIQITRARTVVRADAADLQHMRQALERRQCVALPGLLADDVIRMARTLLSSASYYERTHDGIGREQCLPPGPLTAALELMANDPNLLEVIGEVLGDRVRCFDGRVYRLVPQSEHYDSWHSDAGSGRRLGLSVDLSSERYEGGELEIRRVGTAEPLFRGSPPRAGDGLLFRLSRDLEHQVRPVRGRHPRVVYAGWFRSEPDYWNQLRVRSTASRATTLSDAGPGDGPTDERRQASSREDE